MGDRFLPKMGLLTSIFSKIAPFSRVFCPFFFPIAALFAPDYAQNRPIFAFSGLFSCLFCPF